LKKILVIDDEPTIRLLLREAITEWGYDFLEAARAQKGIDIISSEKVDLVLLDIQLPQMNGLDAIQKIREINQDVPVFMLTAFHNLKDVVSMLDVTIQDFIAKPFDIDELYEKIKKELGD
jgi:DNA-binding response OmpR family regulator